MKIKLYIIALFFGLMLSTLGCSQATHEVLGDNMTPTTTSTSTTTGNVTTSTTVSTTSTMPGAVTTTSTTTTTTIPALLPPDGLQAQSNGSQIDLSWNPSGSGNITGYKVYRQKFNDSGFGLIATVGKDVTSYQDNSVISGQSYLYSIRSYNSVQESNYSLAAVISYVLIDTTPPASPSGLNASASTTVVTLSWQSNPEADLAGYNIYRKVDGESVFSKANGALRTSTYYQDTSLGASTNYQYRITAVDTSGNESSPSTVVPITTLTPPDTTSPAVPTGLSASGGEYQASLSWNSNSESDFNHYNLYQLTRATDGSVSSSYRVSNITSNSYLDEEVSNGTTYYYQLTAVDNSGNESAKTVEISATPASTIDDNSVIRSQLAIYAQGMGNLDIGQVMSTISDNYYDSSTVYGYTTIIHKSDYQTNLLDSFAMQKDVSYSLSVTSVSIVNKTATVKVEIQTAYAGRPTANYDYTGFNITMKVNKTFSLAREGSTWNITRDRTDKEVGFESAPWTSKPGYNFMYQGVILIFDGTGNFSSVIKTLFAQDPAGNPISFSSGMLGLIGYGTLEAGTYTTNVVFTDKSNGTYNLTHNYTVLSSAGGLSASSVRQPSNSVKLIDFVLGRKGK